MKDDTVYLKHIADAIAQIEDYLHEKSFEEFTGNKMRQDAVVRRVPRLRTLAKLSAMSHPWL